MSNSIKALNKIIDFNDDKIRYYKRLLHFIINNNRKEGVISKSLEPTPVIVKGLIDKCFIDLVTSAGAVFNETTGYFEIGIVKDLTYDEMRRIYNRREPRLQTYSLFYYQERAILPYISGSGSNVTQSILNCANLEYIPKELDNSYPWTFLNNGNVNNNPKLKRIDLSIYGNMSNVGTNSFKNCPNLEYVNIKQLNYNIDFNECPKITPECIAYIINNSTSSNITITLSNINYDYNSYPEVINALQNKPNISLNII